MGYLLNGLWHDGWYDTKADPGYSGRVTVPVLWDRERHTIVNNESARQ
jgi:glutathionyl-hydroquinone reductase